MSFSFCLHSLTRLFHSSMSPLPGTRFRWSLLVGQMDTPDLLTLISHHHHLLLIQSAPPADQDQPITVLLLHLAPPTNRGEAWRRLLALAGPPMRFQYKSKTALSNSCKKMDLLWNWGQSASPCSICNGTFSKVESWAVGYPTAFMF